MIGRSRSLMIVGGVLVVAVAVVAAVVLRGGSDAGTVDDPAAGQSTTLNTNSGPAQDIPRRAADDPLVLGRDDAPVTMVVFSELTCRYCVHFATQIQPELAKTYVDSGRLRIEWRDAPTTGPTAKLAARAGRAAAEQDRFWEFADAVVRAPEGTPITIDTLVDHARDAGVDDLTRFRSDAESTRFDDAIDGDLSIAQHSFIPPSPAFWIDGTPLLSGLPIWAFTNVIDGKLSLAPTNGG